MPRRRARSGNIMEWAFDSIITTDATVTNGSVDLDLLPDEIAEIWHINTIIEGSLANANDDGTAFQLMLSMDPNISADPSTVSNHDDLEVFYEHKWVLEKDLETSGMESHRCVDDKFVSFPIKPILVGTNVGVVVKGDADVGGVFYVRLYFTRRRATASELNQILLKRR